MVRSQKDGERSAAIGRTVKMLRESRGWSQDRLAEEADVTRQTVSNVERGGRPDVATLGKIADALNVKIGVLLDADVVVVEIQRAVDKMREWPPDQRDRFVEALTSYRDRLGSDRPKVTRSKR